MKNGLFSPDCWTVLSSTPGGLAHPYARIVIRTMQKISLAALLMTLAWSLPGQAGIAVVANPSSGASSITPGDAERIFLGKDKNLAGAGAVVAMDQAEGSKARAEFLQKVLNKNESQLKAYWSQLIFTGKGTPPAAVATARR